VAHYLFVGEDGTGTRERAEALRAAGMWGIGPGEPHRDALAAGDLVLLYAGPPDRVFVGRAELGSAVHDWTAWERRAYPGAAAGGVLLTRVESWDPPVPMAAVLAEIDRSEGARGDFDTRVVRITEAEHAAALAVAARST
jgi:hypothetical protein